ncbi:MAG TPA: ATP-binding protein [Acidimicrobiales bacterium]|nr:ATP-binding protein [Acidimicrobiales bacterium]
MGDQPPLELTVPEELLRTAIARTKTEHVVADLALMPGVADGKPPPLRPILGEYGVAPIGLMFAAALLPATVESGIGFLAPDIQRTFNISDTALGAVAFAGAAAPLLLGVPVALWADRGRRTTVAAAALAAWSVAVPFLGLAPSVLLFVVFAVLSGIGRAAPNSAHLSYLSDAYPVECRARIFVIHRAADAIGRTAGGGAIALIAAAAGGTAGWRWAMLIGLAGFPVALALTRAREPTKGDQEQAHIVNASGLDATETGGAEPKVLLGSAVQRLLRIKSLYYQFVAMAVLGFAAVGIPLFGALYLDRQWNLGTGERGTVSVIVSFAAFLGIILPWKVGDRLYRRSPDLPLRLGGVSLAAFGVIYATALYMPRLWMVVVGFFLAEACLAPLATAILQTVAATAPPAMRSLTFAMFGVYSVVFGGFAGGVILGAISDARGPRFALTLMGPITVVGGLLLVVGSRYVKGDITLAIEDVLEDYQERRRRTDGGATKALQVHNLDFAYGTNQVLFDVSLEVEDGGMCALLGTNGAGKSTLLRIVAGLDHPIRGTTRVFGSNTTFLEAEQVMAMGVSMLPGGKATFPSLTVEENLRAGSFGFRNDPRLREGIEEVYAAFPVLRSRRGQRAGTLSGGEQQMLALGRALIHRPRLLLIDELTLGLAPIVVEDLLAIVRRINQSGTTVLLVEQSVNLALSLCGRGFFLERGEVRFDGPVAKLLKRDDLLRPVFLGQATP